MLYIFRNATLEPLAKNFFADDEIAFSGYGEINDVPANADNFCWFYTFPFDVGNTHLTGTLDAFLAGLQLVLKRVPADKKIIAVKMTFPQQFACALENDFAKTQVTHYNDTLETLAKTHENLELKSFPPEQLNNIDWRFYFLTQLAFSPNSSPSTLHSPPSTVPATRKKCLVLDLDGTLWAGTLDEDKITCDGAYPANAFRFFQTRIKELAQAGIILAIASKNDLNAVKAIFAQQKMPLALNDFSAIRCNWQDKATQIRELAGTLNIGLDSLVFVDNTPAERAWIRQALPEVAVPEFPKHPYELPQFYSNLLNQYFRAQKLTAEDLQKTAQYQANAARECLLQTCANYDDYLKQLQTQLTFAINDKNTFPRLAQISQKTNQFNLCTQRYKEQDFDAIIARGGNLLALAVSDIFGDNGIVGLAVLEKTDGGNALQISEFALSCRVLGRKIEQQMLAKIIEIARNAGAGTLIGKIVLNEKNAKYKNFYLENNFTAGTGNAGTLDGTGTSFFRLRTDAD